MAYREVVGMKVRHYALRRQDGQFYSPTLGWQPSTTHAMRFQTEEGAIRGLRDLRGDAPATFPASVAIVPVDYTGEVGNPLNGVCATDYDPFGFGRV